MKYCICCDTLASPHLFFLLAIKIQEYTYFVRNVHTTNLSNGGKEITYNALILNMIKKHSRKYSLMEGKVFRQSRFPCSYLSGSLTSQHLIQIKLSTLKSDGLG